MKDKITILDLLPVTAQGILSPEMKADMGKFLPEGADIRHVQIERGSVTIECEYDEAFSAPEVIKLAMPGRADRRHPQRQRTGADE